VPISALRLDPDTVTDLRKLGFERIRDLEATPRAPLTLRFGPLVCRRLDLRHRGDAAGGDAVANLVVWPSLFERQRRV
jgi:hypothetical protein